ncbi:sensor histidine kinase [Streptomyces thermolineatus]|uniref:Oxygen sensor histidine kinase NreB n=1 Tax=Streptomyces thermolineatus TaxID=44033 RepID=A0ABP6A909_9ACTN
MGMTQAGPAVRPEDAAGGAGRAGVRPAVPTDGRYLSHGRHLSRGRHPHGGGEPTVDQWWDRFYRWGPYALLLLAAAASAASAQALMSRGERYALVAVAAALLALQVVHDRSGLPAAHGGRHSRAGRVHFAARTALAFAATWLNPFFSIFATLGYFDVHRYFPQRSARTGLVATALIMAGSQSGGLPPRSVETWTAFGVLFVLNTSLALFFSQLTLREDAARKERLDTIGELERANVRLEQALAENAGLHAQLVAQAREAGVDDERRRLAAEIHDTIAQGLAGIVTQLQAALDDADPQAARARVERAAALARQSLNDARRSVHDLAPAALEHDTLPRALRRAVADWQAASAGRARAELVVTGPAEPLHEEIEATLLRIAQEALANAARHASASRVVVTLSYTADEVVLDVRDDGCGFDPRALPEQSAAGGFGLTGMRRRAERVAGALDVESEPGRGTAVSARVPLVRHG